MNANENLVRIALMGLLLYSMLSLYASGRELALAEEMKAELSAALEVQTAETRQLQQGLDESLNDAELEQLARQRLGLVMPGEKIFYFTTDREE